MKLLVLCALVAVTSAAVTFPYKRYTTNITDGSDPTHSHCRDVDVTDDNDQKTQEWFSANEYKFTSWDTGLCPDNYETSPCEHITHPSDQQKITIRTCGRKPHDEVSAVQDQTTLYTLEKPPDCDEVAIDSKYAAKAMAFDKNLKEGTCKSVGYTVADGTVTKKVPFLGSLTIHKYKKASTEVTMLAPEVTKDCRINKTTEKKLIEFKNAAVEDGKGLMVKIRGCMDPKGYSCKPYKDCELLMAPGSTESIIYDSTFAYFVFTYRHHGVDTELYPDANLKYPTSYTIKFPNSTAAAPVLAATEEASDDVLWVNQPTPGTHAHCVEMAFKGGKKNAYYQAHGYQYQPPIWASGRCPNPPYNWFNKNETIAEGVVETTLGRH
jgi:hypothetical protein